MKSLDHLKSGQSGRLASVSGDPALAQRLMAMGLLPGQPLVRRQQAPLSGPIKIHSASSVIALRTKDAACVVVNTQCP